MNKRTSNIQHRTLNIERVEALRYEEDSKNQTPNTVMQTPNPKTRIPNMPQISISNREPPQRGLEFDAWDFFGAWGLGVENLACDRQGTPDR